MAAEQLNREELARLQGGVGTSMPGPAPPPPGAGGFAPNMRPEPQAVEGPKVSGGSRR